MKGSDYVAVVRLSNAVNKTLAQPGERCDQVPEASLGWLLEQGLIAPAGAVRETTQAAAEPEPEAELEQLQEIDLDTREGEEG
jgi:hypothetical protein